MVPRRRRTAMGRSHHLGPEVRAGKAALSADRIHAACERAAFARRGPHQQPKAIGARELSSRAFRAKRSTEIRSKSEAFEGSYAPWHFLNFLPLPHQHGSLR